MAHHDNPGHVGIRTKEHKLIFYYGAKYDGSYRTPPAWELYDLRKDPQENVNVYDDPIYKEIVADLKQRFVDLRRRVGDTGEDYPKVESIIQEFWDYDGDDRAEAIAISNEFLSVRKQELANHKNK
jgi:N-acetylglucosamine-6-sulfatase